MRSWRSRYGFLVVEGRTPQYPNVATRHGRVVHAATHDALPQCGYVLYRRLFTDADVNCPRCARAQAEVEALAA